MGCCTSSFKTDMNATLDSSVYKCSRRDKRVGGSKRSYSSSCATTDTGLGSACQTPSRRSLWSPQSKSKPVQQRSICDDFAEQQQLELERSCGYFTCSSGASTPSKSEAQLLRRTQDMDRSSSPSGSQSSRASTPAVSDLEWEMYMMTHAQRIMPKTSSPFCQRRDSTSYALPALPSKSYHKWRNYLQSTPAHMLHNVTHIPEAIAGHFCPTDFPAFSDLEEMESAAKRYKVDATPQLYTTYQLLAGQTHTISTDL